MKNHYGGLRVIHLTHVSTLSGWVLPYPAGYEFPLPFGLLAFAFWVIPIPLGSSVALAVDLLENPDPIGVITFHMFEM